MTEHTVDLMAPLRVELRFAVEQGVIKDWALRKGGRATIYLRSGNKVYTTDTLDTLRIISREREALPSTVAEALGCLIHFINLVEATGSMSPELVRKAQKALLVLADDDA